MPKIIALMLAFLAVPVQAQEAGSSTRPRAPELGIKVGVLRAGPLDAITDVAGVAVGHTTIIRGDNIRTDRKSTPLNSSHLGISYAVFCLKKKKEGIAGGVEGSRIKRLRRPEAKRDGEDGELKFHFLGAVTVEEASEKDQVNGGKSERDHPCREQERERND